MKHIGQNIRKLRKIKKLSQGDVARSLCIAVATLSNIETGITDISISRLIQISCFFEVPVSKIISQNIDSTSNIQLVGINKHNDDLGLKYEEIIRLQSRIIDLYGEIKKCTSWQDL